MTSGPVRIVLPLPEVGVASTLLCHLGHRPPIIPPVDKGGRGKKEPRGSRVPITARTWYVGHPSLPHLLSVPHPHASPGDRYHSQKSVSQSTLISPACPGVPLKSSLNFPALFCRAAVRSHREIPGKSVNTQWLPVTRALSPFIPVGQGGCGWHGNLPCKSCCFQGCFSIPPGTQLLLWASE